MDLWISKTRENQEHFCESKNTRENKEIDLCELFWHKSLPVREGWSGRFPTREDGRIIPGHCDKVNVSLSMILNPK